MKIRVLDISDEDFKVRKAPQNLYMDGCSCEFCGGRVLGTYWEVEGPEIIFESCYEACSRKCAERLVKKMVDDIMQASETGRVYKI